MLVIGPAGGLKFRFGSFRRSFRLHDARLQSQGAQRGPDRLGGRLQHAVFSVAVQFLGSSATILRALLLHRFAPCDGFLHVADHAKLIGIPGRPSGEYVAFTNQPVVNEPSFPVTSAVPGHLMDMRHFVVGVFLFAAGLFADSFPPADVKIVGDLSYGETRDAVECTHESRYCAFVFNGKGGERVDVVVKSTGQAFVAIGDPSLNELARGTGHLTLTLPNRGPDAEGYYIVFRDGENKDGRFTVELKKLPAEAAK